MSSLREKLKKIVALEAARPEWQRGMLAETRRSTCTTPRKPIGDNTMGYNTNYEGSFTVKDMTPEQELAIIKLLADKGNN